MANKQQKELEKQSGVIKYLNEKLKVASICGEFNNKIYANNLQNKKQDEFN